MSRKNTWGLITVLLVVALTAGVIYFQTSARLKETDGKSPLRLGMDLQGGVMLVMEVQDPPTGTLTPELVEDTRAAMEKRIDQLGVVEPQVERLQGDNWNRINFSLPVITALQQALEEN